MWIRNNRIAMIMAACISLLTTGVVVAIRWNKTEPVEESIPPLPTFSISAEPDLLWSNDEIPIHLQFIDKDGQIAYESDAGMTLFGGQSRNEPQKSLELKARKKYGAKKFDHPFFPDREVAEFERLVLRNGGQDFSRTHMRDSLAAILAEPILGFVQANRPVVVRLNEQYWGIYDLREKSDERWIAAHYGYHEKSIDLLESDGEVKSGSDAAFQRLLEVLGSVNLSEEERLEQLLQIVDVQSLFDYMILEIYIGNKDWPDHNIRYWRSDEGDGKWRWMLYDADQAFESPNEPTMERLMSKKLSKHPSVKLFQVVLRDRDMKTKFLRRFAELLKGELCRERVIAEIENRRGLLAPEMVRHQERWNGTMDNWQAEVDLLVRFANRRETELVKQLQVVFQLSDKEMVTYGFETSALEGERKG